MLLLAFAFVEDDRVKEALGSHPWPWSDFSSSAASPVSAAVDLTGSWHISLVANQFGVTRECDAAFEQTGDHVDGAFDCSSDGTGTLSGTLTDATQGATIEATFALVSGATTINATATLTVSGDGNSISGTWESAFLGGLTGTFEGERLAFPKGDLNCDNKVDGRDVLVSFTYLAGAEAIQGPACPSLGSGVVLIFGDMDCSTAVGILDGRFIMLHWAGVSFELPDSCAPIGL